jgi:hypothetical protein
MKPCQDGAGSSHLLEALHVEKVALHNALQAHGGRSDLHLKCTLLGGHHW